MGGTPLQIEVIPLQCHDLPAPQTRLAAQQDDFAVLTEYDPPSRLAYKSATLEGPDADMLVTVEFTEAEGRTMVRLMHTGIPDMRVDGDVELREIIRAGWAAAFGKLGQFLGAKV